MLKRQDSSLSASRRQSAAGTTPPPPETHHAKAIGCMSGIFHLFSKYQNPNKRLTSGKKQEKKKPSSQKSSTTDSVPPKDDKTETHKFNDAVIKVPRSPTLPPEIRRSNFPTSTPPSSSLVARLMGLDDIGAAVKLRGIDEDPFTEKRQRLLQALEKCNEDLEALKSIIKAVQTASAPPKKDHSDDGNDAVATKPCTEEGNIPAEEITRSPLRSYSGAARVPQQRKPTVAKKPGEDDEPMAKVVTKSTLTMESSPVMRQQAAVAPPWSSRAMVESVEEVCNDIAWGEKREIGRIGLVVQDYVCRELIDELVREMKPCSIVNDHPLPLEACKRKLCF